MCDARDDAMLPAVGHQKKSRMLNAKCKVLNYALSILLSALSIKKGAEAPFSISVALRLLVLHELANGCFATVSTDGFEQVTALA